MATRRTWLWIILGCLGVIVLGLLAIAGAGVYFVVSHIDTEAATSAEAMREFDAVRGRFKDQQPLFELDADDRPRAARRIGDLPTSALRPRELAVMVWDADEGRLIRISLPFWLLRMGGQQIEISDGRGFRFDELDVDVDQLERIGPALVFDYRTPEGERVLLWTR